MKRCPHCGRTFDDSLAFCQHDATPLVALAVAPIPPPRPIPTPQPVSTTQPAATAGAQPEVPEYLRDTPARGLSNRTAWIVVGALALVGLLGLGVYFLLLRQSGLSGEGAEMADSTAMGSDSAARGTTGPFVPPDDGPAQNIRYAESPNDGFLALRSDPSISQGSRLLRIPHGAAVTVLYTGGPSDVIEGKSGTWVQVQYGSTVGWAFDAFLRNESQNSTSGATLVPDGMVAQNLWATVYEPKDGWLNMRGGGNARAAIITRIDNGQQVFVHYCRADVVQSPGGQPGRWCYVGYDNRSGWAFDAYLVGVSR